jgi:4-amino-4-deoxy-L-arabinose transferase-like glycosyltransferase
VNSSPHQRRQSWALLAGLWLLLLLLAPLRPLVMPDEGRYGEIGRWMLISGDWLTPRLNGLPFFHKPPL